MSGQFIAGVCLAILAALLINIGKAVQKQKVHVFLQGRRALHAPHRSELGVWGLGTAMTLSAMLPFSLALKLTESPSLVASMTGVGLIGLALYAVFVIGERFERLDLAGVALVVAGTSALAHMGAGVDIGGRAVLGFGMLKAMAPLLLVCAVCCSLSFKYRRVWGVAWGVSAGASLGVALIIGDVALMESGGDFMGQLRNPYPYIAILASIPAMVGTQIGFLRARALEVVPAVNSSVILTPLLLERLMYGSNPGLARMGFIAVIVTGVILLSMSTAAKVSEAPASEEALATAGSDAPLESAGERRRAGHGAAP